MATLITGRRLDEQPKLLHGMVIGSEYADDTVMCSPPPAIAIPVTRALAPIGRLLGYRPRWPAWRLDHM
jgi:hypothetical protein